jgi:hypothetical protein
MLAIALGATRRGEGPTLASWSWSSACRASCACCRRPAASAACPPSRRRYMTQPLVELYGGCMVAAKGLVMWC